MLKRSLRAVSGVLLTLAALSSAPASDAATTGDDRAARGLDVFVHAPEHAAPLAVVPVQVVAYGFPTVTSMVPLPGAEVEAVWDPESLGGGISAAPAPVRASTDAEGKVHLNVPVPEGHEGDITLLIGVTSGERRRARAITVRRVRPSRVALYLPDASVVPGGVTSAWVRVTSATTGEPTAGANVDVTLNEGSYARSRYSLRTDSAGMAMARVAIPRVDESTWAFSITAAVENGASDPISHALALRDETPGSPRLLVSFLEDAVKAGDRVRYVVRVRDAVDQPLSGLAVRTWIGPKGTEPPTDKKEWEKASRAVVTDGSGAITGEAQAPSTVAPGTSTSLRLVVRTNVEGQELAEESVVQVGYPSSKAELIPEASAIVPGLAQKMLLRVLDGHRKPVSATFALEGDGLRERVTTDAFGEAEVTWSPPLDLGAFRNVGPCAGGVAAAVLVRPQGEVPALGIRREPFELCVSVDRDASAIVRPEGGVLRAGDTIAVRVAAVKEPQEGARRPGAQAAPEPWSLVLRSGGMGQALSLWTAEGDAGAQIKLPESAAGLFTVGAAGPSAKRKARLASGAFLVAPRVLPKVLGKIVGGRAAPGGEVEIEASLTDGKGAGLPGTVAAVVVDLHGGGSVDALSELDTRASLCRRARAPEERCDALLEGGADMEPLRRALLSSRAGNAIQPVIDPGGSAQQELNKAFGEVLRSLEGAVFEATESADRLRDVRRRGPNGWAFNPELLTLVTAAMEPRPETPGGEPLTLADLVAVDNQVTFDNVAKRVTRLKLFRILAEVRSFRLDRRLDPEEPALKDPNAVLRRLVRDGRIPQDLLLDPWGGTIQFMKAAGPPLPFLSVARGFELRAPGPDRLAGTPDDIRDPFERVVRSGTPYAEAVSEDRIVDAKVDMEVGDATVSAWEAMFAELTGTALGGMGLSGIGEGGGGRGEGIGLGSIGTIGHGRGTEGVPTGVAFWSRPIRTDAGGKARIRVPLGPIETTWRVALLGVPDAARPAVSTVDVPVELPLSARVSAGARWAEGDEVAVAITVRSRAAKPVRAAVEVAAAGVLALSDPKQKSLGVDVPAGGAAVTKVWVKATRPGQGVLHVTSRAPGVAEDKVSHTWEVVPKGEPLVVVKSRWIEASEEVRPAIDPVEMRRTGAPRLVLERGDELALMAALEALDPDRASSPGPMADAVEAGVRVGRWAVPRLGERSPLARKASEIARRAAAKLEAQISGALKIQAHAAPPSLWAVERRRLMWAPAALAGTLGDAADCPGTSAFNVEAAVAGLRVEPPPVGGVVKACWNAFVTNAVREVIERGDPEAMASAVLALVERPHREVMAVRLIDRLRERVSPSAGGEITLPEASADDRAARSIVLAALLRGARIGKPSPASEERLLGWLRVQRDARGGYGSTAATASAVQALVAASPSLAAKVEVTVTAGDWKKSVALGPSERVIVPLAAGVEAARVEARGGSVLARMEQPVLRLWSRPPSDAGSPLHLETTWPADARAGSTAALQVSLSQKLGRATVVDARIPLPPGVSLAAKVTGVRQIQGVLLVRSTLDKSGLPLPLAIPLRFLLSGRVTAPEARARLAFEEAPIAVAPARPFVIR